ncbi:hypothetical protein EMCRGX_G029379 [Ephydatia muelleri]
MRSECMMFGSQDTRMTSDGIRPSRFGEKTLKRDGTDLSACKAIFQKLGIDWATDGDCRIVRRVCEAISTRAARLATMGIVTILRKIGKLDKCTVAIDGTLYEKHPHFRERMISTMEELAPGNTVQLKKSEDGSGRGAATVAAAIAAARHESSCAFYHWDQRVTLVTIGSACVPNQDAGHGLVAVPGVAEGQSGLPGRPTRLDFQLGLAGQTLI